MINQRADRERTGLEKFIRADARRRSVHSLRKLVRGSTRRADRKRVYIYIYTRGALAQLSFHFFNGHIGPRCIYFQTLPRRRGVPILYTDV